MELHKPKAKKNLPFLAEHIVVLILSKLPVKSLIKFRRVSKQWLALITSPEVIQGSLNHQKATNPMIIFGSTKIFTKTIPRRLGNTWTLTPESTVRYFELSHILPRLNLPRHSWGKISIVGSSCNGLICVSLPKPNTTSLALYNPATKDLRVLPELSAAFGDEGVGRVHTVTIGFGFDPISKVYKFVRILGFYSEYYRISASINEVQVFDKSGNNSWRRLEDLPKDIDLPYQFEQNHKLPIAIEGALHWWVVDTSDGTGEDYCVLSFDLHSEKFKKIASPPRNYDSRVNLSKWRDSLVARVDYDFWVLNENNNDWTMLFKIDIPLGVREFGLLGVWKDQLVLGTNGKYKLMLYQDPQLSGQRFVKVKELMARGSGLGASLDYVESLVSVH